MNSHSIPTQPTPVPSFSDLCGRLARCAEAVRALRVLRWSLEWPAGHSERPASPRFVSEFEAIHGAAPESALRVLADFVATFRAR